MTDDEFKQLKKYRDLFANDWQEHGSGYIAHYLDNTIKRIEARRAAQLDALTSRSSERVGSEA